MVSSAYIQRTNVRDTWLLLTGILLIGLTLSIWGVGIPVPSVAFWGFFMLGTAGFLIAYRYYSDFFSPIGVFCLSWFIPISLHQLGLSDLQEPLDLITWSAILGSAVSFLAGAFTVMHFFPFRRLSHPKPKWSSYYNKNRLRLAMASLLVLSMTAFLYESTTGHGIPILLPPEERTKAYLGLSQRYIHYLAVSSIVVGALAFVYLYIYGRRGMVWGFAMLGLSTLVIVAIMARLQLLMILFSGLVVWNYLYKRLKLRDILITFLAILILMNVLGDMRTGGGTDYLRSIYQLNHLPEWADFAAWPYAYLSLGYETLRRIITDGYPSTSGAMTFRPLLAFALLRSSIPLPDFSYAWSDSGFNTATYLWELFSDFGLVGTIVIPFFYAAFATWFYHKLRRDTTITLVLVYCYVLYSIAFLFQGNGFAFPALYIFALETWLILWFSRRRRLIR